MNTSNGMIKVAGSEIESFASSFIEFRTFRSITGSINSFFFVVKLL